MVGCGRDYQGMINRGNWHRLKECMKKARRGEKIITGFLGGSITQGSLSSGPELCYAYLVFQWWREKFPLAEIEFINGGIGGTTSQFGAARVKGHILKYKPDFVLIEFAVNDENTEFFQETYEGLVRKTYMDKCKPALMLMNNVRYDNGINAEQQHLKVAQAYELPMVSMKSAIWPEIMWGRLKEAELSPDGLHPNDAGHRLVAQVIISFLEQVYAEMDKEETLAFGEGDRLPAPITANAYENAIRYQNFNSESKAEGFLEDLSSQNGITDIFKRGWTASRKGDKIRFEVEGTEIAVQYRKSVNKPVPVARAVVDGREDQGVILDGNFEEDWGDSLHIDTIARHAQEGKHTVEIEIVESHENDVAPFYLVSLIVSGNENKNNILKNMEDKDKMKPILFLNPVFKETIWGGSKLREQYGYDIPSDTTGECWAVSAHPNGDCVVKEGEYQGMTLSELWEKNPELFGSCGLDRFPLLTKIIDARENLSIQVHPNDAYAGEHENGSLGKTECWYILDCPEDAALIIGHNAGTEKELEEMIRQGKWTEFIREIPVKKGDFIQIDPGTVHAIKGGIMLLETQQNSDITYRVYDYDRLSDGKPRQLHIQQSIDVITVPALSPEDSVKEAANLPANVMNELISCDYYKVWKLDVTEPVSIEQTHPFLIMSVVEGEGCVNGRKIEKGEHFILPDGFGKVELEGNMQLIASSIK